MRKWQDVPIKKITRETVPLTVVTDRAYLMQNEELIGRLQSAGYELITFANEIEFRHAFEARFRSVWDAGQETAPVLVLHHDPENTPLPYDLLVKGRQVEIGLPDLFPLLDVHLVAELDVSYYDRLYQTTESLERDGRKLGTQETITFLLRAVFDIDPLSITSPEKLVSLLIEKHYAHNSIPPMLCDDLFAQLGSKHWWTHPLEELFDSSDLFFDWLSQEWESHVRALLEQNGRSGLDFQEPLLRLHMDRLLAEGYVRKWQLADSQALMHLPPEQQWIVVGLETKQASGTLNSLSGKLTTSDARIVHMQLEQWQKRNRNGLTLRDWLDVGVEWGHLVNQVNRLPLDDFEQVYNDFLTVRRAVNQDFYQFIEQAYAMIGIYDDNKGPIALHRVNYYLNKMAAETERIALVVMDGMAIDQWLIVRGYLEAHAGLSFQENKTFAIAPTVTSFSRQSLFAGQLPSAFPESLYTTAQEKKHWENYWVNKGRRKKRIEHLHVKVTDDFSELRVTADNNRNEVLGIVVNLIDDLMHAAKDVRKGKRFFYDSIVSYLENSNLPELFQILQQAGYRIFITSDHGNIEAIGLGVRPPGKDLVETYAKRAVVFDRQSLGVPFVEQHQLLTLTTSYLKDLYVTYPPDNNMFATTGTVEISHGGLSLEEMVVPFVEVKRS